MHRDEIAAEPRPEDLRSANEHLVIRSVHDQEVAERAVQQRAELSALIEALGDGVIIADGTGRVLMMNAGARAVTGVTVHPRTVADLDIVEIRGLDDAPFSTESQPLRRAMRGEIFLDLEVQVVLPGAGPRRVMASGTSVVVAGEIVLAIVVLRDVTERTALSARVAHAERLAALGTMTAGVAHEINNPLTYVLANVEFALDALRDAQEVLREVEVVGLVSVRTKLLEVESVLAEAREGSLRAHGIVRKLKQLAPADDAERYALDLKDGLESALSLTESRVRLSSRVRRDYGVTPAVLANVGQLEQIFTHALINAAQAIGEGSADSHEIVVATYTDAAGRAIAEVRDTGPGIPPDVLGRVFDPFLTTRAIGQGMGLGLSISYAIARSIGGELSVESKLGVGTTFRLALCAAVPPSIIAVPVARPADAGRRGAILLIDDDPAVGRAIGRVLAGDHDVTVLTDAALALERLTAGEAFDLILCDLMMPSMTGMEFYARLLVEIPDAARKVVLVTGGAFSEAASAFLGSFAQPTLNKPIDVRKLRALAAVYAARPRLPAS